MTVDYINQNADKIREEIREGRIREALSLLEAFTANLEEDDLDNQVLMLFGRFSNYRRNQNAGTVAGEEEHNRIIASVVELSKAAKNLALKKYANRFPAKVAGPGISAKVEAVIHEAPMANLQTAPHPQILPGMPKNFEDPRDGQWYASVEIAGLEWMAQNLNFEHPESWRVETDPRNFKKSGRLYTYEGAIKSAPAGWHLPTQGEWISLFMHFGWYTEDLYPCYEALIEGGPSGFSVRLTGLRTSEKYKEHAIGQVARFWTMLENSSNNSVEFSANDKRVIMASTSLSNGISCRYVKDY